jgi:hypothetical protein
MGLFKKLFKRNYSPANSALDQVLRKLATDDSPKIRERFYRELLDSRLFLATPGAAVAEEVPVNCPITNEKEDGIGFIATNGPDGKPAMIVFTGQAGFEAWQTEGCECVEMPSGEIFKLAINNQINSIVINPRGPFGGFITQREIRALAEGSIPGEYRDGLSPQQISKDSKMVLGKPILPPRNSLVSEVRKQAENHPEISAAYIVQGVIGNGEPHLIIALQMIAGASVDKVVPPIAQSVQKILTPGEYVDFYPLFPKDELIALLPTYGPPVYQANS